MFELIQVSENCYYIQSPAKIGLVRTGPDTVCLIDSGNDKSAGRKIRQVLDREGWKLEAIYNTHSHADHIGGNCYLQNQTGCRIYAPGIERDFTEHPVLEPSYLFGGNPPKDLRHKFLMAQSSQVLPLTQEVLPDGFAIIPLPGHTWDMVGFRTADDIVYLADCLSSIETLEKYRICFLVDVQAYLNTLEAVLEMKAKLFVPAHAVPQEDIAPLVRANIDQVHEIAGHILEICREPVSFEAVLKALFDRYNLELSFEQYALVGSTLRSYLTWLKDQEKMDVIFRDNMLLWKSLIQ